MRTKGKLNELFILVKLDISKLLRMIDSSAFDSTESATIYMTTTDLLDMLNI